MIFIRQGVKIVSVIANFLRWQETAKVAERVTAAAALARAYVQRELTLEQSMSAEAALISLLDDPSPKVRLAMSEALCMSARAPLEVVTALAFDQREVAGPIIAHSPLLTESDLIDILDATGVNDIQVMVASRPHISAKVIAAITAVGSAEACAALLVQQGAHIASCSLRRMVERFGGDGSLRVILLKHQALPADCRHMLLQKISDTLGTSPFVTGVLGVRAAAKIVGAARARASLALVDDIKPGEQAVLVERMRETGELTSAFLTRAVAHGQIGFFGSVLVTITGVTEARVKALLDKGSTRALVALLNQAGLRAVTHAPVLTALAICREIAQGRRNTGPQEISWMMLETLEKSSEGNSQERIALTSLLRRIFLEELRQNARRQALSLAAA